jgi:DNA polymerase-3 subunit epsilon
MREIILDTETTGLNPAIGHRIIEIGCVEIFNKSKTGKIFHFHINPEREVPEEAFKIHGISTEFLKDKPVFKDIAQQFVDFIEDSPLIIHNAPFDIKFLNAELAALNYDLIEFQRAIDTLILARKKFPGSPVSLDALCKRFKISNAHRTKHGALLDSELLYEVYIALTEGVQSELKLHEANKILGANKNLETNKPLVPYRTFPVSEEENAAHQEFIQKIEKTLWQSN